jgi:hypothetical protein
MIFAAMGGEDFLYCCGMCPILPLVVLLVIVAVIRNSLLSASLAFLIAGLPYVILQTMVALYEPSTDGEVAANQFTGRSAVGFYDWIVAIAVLSLLWVGVMRILRRNRAPVAPPPPLSTPPSSPPFVSEG